MIRVEWQIKRGDIVKVQSDSGPRPLRCYGVVTSCSPYRDQLSLFPVVKVYTFSAVGEQEFYPYNLEIVSAI